MPGLKSLVVLTAIASIAMMSAAQAASGRKAIKQPATTYSSKILDSRAQFFPATPDIPYQGTRGLSAPAGRS